MHKNKKRLQKEREKSKWSGIISWIVLIILGLIIAIPTANWVQSLPFMQPHYAKPGELSFANGLWELIFYCICLTGMIFAGYLLARRIDRFEQAAATPKNKQASR